MHASCVDAWLARDTRGLARPDRGRLFEDAFRAVWARTCLTLGEVTLAAVADRVLHLAGEQFPMFAAIAAAADGSLHWAEPIDPDRRGQEVDAELHAGVRFVLTELLTLLGHLTAEVLTPELHDELGRVSPTHVEDPRS